MPRPAKIWLRSENGFYYVTFKGEKVKLSQDRKEADRLFHELMAKKDEVAPPTRLGPSFKKLADEFLKDTQGEKDERTVKIQAKVLQQFCDRMKGIRAADLKGHQVKAWLAWENEWRKKKGRRTWGTSTQSLAIKTIKAVLNWGVRIGHLTENPIKKLSGGTVARRDRIVTAEQLARIKDLVKPNFRDFLTVVEQTGARPYSEIGRLEAKDIDFEKGSATLTKHKTSKKTGKPRVIYFTPAALEVLRRLSDRYPTGLLFRTKRNSGWNQNNSMKWSYLIKEKLGIEFNPYCMRHVFITNALLRGVPVEVVAELVGNTPQMIHKHYSHVGKNHDALRAALLKAVG